MKKLVLIILLQLVCALSGAMRSTLAAPPPAVHQEAIIDVRVKSGGLKLTNKQIENWVHDSALGVSRYFGRFPVDYIPVIIEPVSGKGVKYSSVEMENGKHLVHVTIGKDSDQSDLNSDWRLTHEFVHLAFPMLPDKHAWLAEGFATYLEPFAQLQVGRVNKQKIWKDLVEGLPNGLPKPGDKGLDRTHTWARTYWGGALYCFLADLEIRKRTQNRYGLRDAVSGILAAGGDINSQWPVDKALAAGDNATKTHVLTELHTKMHTPQRVSLTALFNQLGVMDQSGRVVFEPGSLSKIRDAISAVSYHQSAPFKIRMKIEKGAAT